MIFVCVGAVLARSSTLALEHLLNLYNISPAKRDLFLRVIEFEVLESLSLLFMELPVLSAALLRANSQTQKLTNSQTRPYFLALGRLAPYLERR